VTAPIPPLNLTPPPLPPKAPHATPARPAAAPVAPSKPQVTVTVAPAAVDQSKLAAATSKENAEDAA